MGTVSKDGLMHGKINGLVYYVVNGKQRVRTAEKKHKSRKKDPEKPAHCDNFGMMSKVAGWLLPAIKIGLHKDARRRKIFHHNVFIKLNKNMFADGKVDYENLIVSKGQGQVPMAKFRNLTVSKSGVIEADFDARLATEKAEEVYVAVLCPDLGDCKLSDGVDRRAGHIRMRIPRGWLRHELHGYGFVKRTGLFTSPSEYLQLNAPAEATEN